MHILRLYSKTVLRNPNIIHPIRKSCVYKKYGHMDGHWVIPLYPLFYIFKHWS